eukprot:6491533-Prymnesium_polylepis.1
MLHQVQERLLLQAATVGEEEESLEGWRKRMEVVRQQPPLAAESPVQVDGHVATTVTADGGPKKRRKKLSHFVPAAFRKYVRDQHPALGNSDERGPPNDCVKDAADSLKKHLKNEYQIVPPYGTTNMAMMVMAVRAWAHGKGQGPDELPLRPGYLIEHNVEGGIPPFALEGEPGFEAWLRFKQDKLVPLAEAQCDAHFEKKHPDGEPVPDESSAVTTSSVEAAQHATTTAAEPSDGLDAIATLAASAAADVGSKKRLSHFIPAAFRRYVRDHTLLGGPGEKGPPNDCVKDAAESLKRHLQSEYHIIPPEGITNMAMM